MSGLSLLLLSSAYVLMLFAIARYGDSRADARRSIISANVYALSLAVFCTSWTFYGSVGRATETGLSFLTVYLGPTLMLMMSGVVMKMIRISKANRITSIADFIASRYGKSHFIAGLVTVLAVVGIVPYIALQLKAVSASLEVLFGESPNEWLGMAGVDSTFFIALMLGTFAVLFGTRHLDATERHEGMVAAIAFESIVKLVAFIAVGLFVTYGIYDGFADLFDKAADSPRLQRLLEPNPERAINWALMILLSGLASVLLPRQFQVMVVENVDESHVRRAVWLFPLYLLLINIFVLPLALGGVMLDEAGLPDTYVLSLPMLHGNVWLAVLVFIGGLAAATGMVIVETIALSTMVCNDLVMPIVLQTRLGSASSGLDLYSRLISIRRWAILVILSLGYLYYRGAGDAYALVGIGLISFAAVAQFAPALFGGMYWKQATRAGAIAGLCGGFVIWFYTLLLPSFAKSDWISDDFLQYGLFGLEFLRAQALFGLSGMDEITHCLWWSFIFNAGLYVLVSLYSRPAPLEAGQAERFVDVYRLDKQASPLKVWRGKASINELVTLLERFLGPERAQGLLTNFAHDRGLLHWRELPADAESVHFVESELAGAIGSASARVMVASVVEEEVLGLEEVLNILDETSQIRAYSHELELKSQALEAATTDLREANDRLRELDRMKDDFISTVTHELRTPLTSIRALSEMLFDDPKMDLDSRKRFLGIIVSETERLTRLINQILDMAKLESGRAEWNSSEVDLKSLLEDVMLSLSQLFNEKSVSLSADLPEQVPPVMADPDRLTQVVINLLSNSVKFVPGGSGKVLVRLTHDAHQVKVEVIDNGPGLTDEECTLVFEKFRQGGNTMTDKPQGTGLGLPISRQIVEYFGGQLWVESQPGRGANFTFTVPFNAPDKKYEGEAAL